jgi:peptidyl-prolyl cis-trans isomerase SurA
MRKLFFLLIFIGMNVSFVFSQKKQDVVVTIGNEKVLANDFRKVYERNNGNIVDPAEKKTPEQYLDLYVNFKLKVLEAQAMGLDTSQAFLEEFAGYRAELAAPYLTDVSYTEKLVEETYRRMTLEVNASHILVTFPQDPSPADTLAAYSRLLEIKAEIDGGLDFNEAASKYSQDPSASQNRGALGWFTAFQMVTPFEDAAYNTPAGRVSAPVRTRFGYHLIKVNDLREAKGEIKIAHIMKMFPPDITDEKKQALRDSINYIYGLLQNGGDFAHLAGVYSDDQRSAANGGEMPYFGRSRMIPEFSDPAFALAKDGDITQPVETDFGFHIIRRIDLKSVPSFIDAKRELEERIRRDPDRSTRSRELFIKKLKNEYRYVKNQQVVDKKMDVVTSWFKEGNLVVPEAIDDSDVLFMLDDKDFTAKDWFEYLSEQSVSAADNPIKILESQYAAWEEFAIVQYEDGKLEEKYPEFRSLVQEYHDGLLLFSVSEKKIWQRASSDTLGLLSFYETNKQKYMWGERYRGVIISCADPEIIDDVEDKLDQGIPPAELYDMFGADENLIRIEEGTWSKGENKIIDFFVWNGVKPDDWKAESVFVKGELIGSEPKFLDESRGFHISDYQQFLEENWLRELKQKYTVKVNRRVLKTIDNV